MRWSAASTFRRRSRTSAASAAIERSSMHRARRRPSWYSSLKQIRSSVVSIGPSVRAAERSEARIPRPSGRIFKSSDETLADGVVQELRRRAHAELAVDAEPVRLDGLGADAQRARDLLRAPALEQPAEHFALAHRERREAGVGLLG